MSNHKLKLTLALAAALLSGHSAAQDDDDKNHSPSTHTTADLPDGFTVLEKHVEAIGGVEANMKIKGLQMLGTFEMPNVGPGGISGTIDIKMAAPNKRVMAINVEGFGEINQGTDGKVAWTTQMPGTPPTVLEGEAAQEQIDDAEFYGRVKPREQYTSAETVGVFTHDDVKVYKVKLIDKSGKHSEALYEVESGLLRKQSFKDSAEDTAFSSETEFNDYRAIDGEVRMPFQLVVEANQMGQVITFEKVVTDPKFAEDAFDAPGSL